MRPQAAVLGTVRRRPPGPARLLRAARIIHPFPTSLNVAATAALAFIAAGGVPPAGLLARMLLLMLLAQSAIGVTNDYCDRHLDAATKPWKPVAAGVVAPAAAIALAVVLVLATVTVAATLGPVGFALALAGLACGLAYDVRLKRTPLSALPFMAAIPILPLWVWAVLGQWRPALWWLLPLGAPVGLALHLANTLPDIEADAAHGVRGLAHRLGAAHSMLLGWSSFAAALALTAALAPSLRYDLRWYAPAALVGAVSLATSILTYTVRRDGFALQLGFGLLALGSAIVAVGWLAGVTAA